MRKKADWVIIREAQESGHMVSMSFLSLSNESESSTRLHEYFRSKLPHFDGSFDEDEGEQILGNISAYVVNAKVDLHLFDYPHSEGASIRLLPITENLQLRVIAADDYYGSGDYNKYVSCDQFLVNAHTTTQDVDDLIAFVKEHLTVP